MRISLNHYANTHLSVNECDTFKCESWTTGKHTQASEEVCSVEHEVKVCGLSALSDPARAQIRLCVKHQGSEMLQ